MIDGSGNTSPRRIQRGRTCDARHSQLKDAQGADEDDESRDVGDGSANDKATCPVDRNKDGPKECAAPSVEIRSVEVGLHDLVVEDLDPDVSVEYGGTGGAQKE